MKRILLFVLLLAALSPAADKPPKDLVVFPVGKPFRLSDAKGQYVALHFLLKTECPYCLRYTHEYATKAKTVPGVVHIFLKPDSSEAIAKWMDKLDAKEGDQPTIYRDEEAKLATAFGIPDGYAFHGEKVHYPALVLLDPKGVEVFRYVGKNNADRLPFDTFAAKVKELKASRE